MNKEKNKLSDNTNYNYIKNSKINKRINGYQNKIKEVRMDKIRMIEEGLKIMHLKEHNRKKRQ